jgi:subtilisin-like proprotein convertase family protein
LEEVNLPESARREFEPVQYTAYRLDYAALTAHLANAPREFSEDAKKRACLAMLPMADGHFEEFSLVKTSPMVPELEAQHPEILTLTGASTKTPGMLVRITVTPYWGLRAMILRPDKGYENVQPVALGQNDFYMAYLPEHEPKDPDYYKLRKGWDPDTKLDFSHLKDPHSNRFSLGAPGPEDGKEMGGLVKLKKYKFAVACTGEFSQDNGGTKDAVFQKVTTTTNNLNIFYERDLNIRLELIAESYDIIFLDPATDPYTGTTVGEWMSQNPVAMFNVLGSTDKYDVGHVFARYMGGNAIGVAGGLCCTQTKGRGCSAGTGSYGAEFFNTIGQEVGHMWGGWHTWNRCDQITEPFPDIDRCEPGSGNTIMSYYGACGSDNTGGNFALFYHTCSIATIRNFVENGVGNTCGSETTTNNNHPVVTIPQPKNLFIPISTPFTLTGSAFDPDGDALTYSWDQIDIGPPSLLGTPIGNAPAFIWRTPTTSPTRTFPRMQTIINNSSEITEVLPTYNRDLTFALVARDNKPGGGGIGFDTIFMRSTTAAGPFTVSYPNSSNAVWRVGEYQTVTWNVANTDKAPVNCKRVSIYLSTSGGQSFTIPLAENVPNIGRACVQVPNNVTNNARIQVRAADNVFFDISNTNFRIEQPNSSGFSLCAASMIDQVCLPATFSTELSTAAIAGFSGPITFTATGLPNGAVATFSQNPVAAGSSTTVTVTFAADTPEGTYDITIMGTSGAESASSLITLTTVRSDFSAFATTSPVNGATSVNPNPLLQWTTVPDADAYEAQLATNPSFAPSTIVASADNTTASSLQIVNPLAEGKVYYWRARPKNACGNGEWSDVKVFVTSVFNCVTLEANDLPKSISANGTPTVESQITLLAGGEVNDLNLRVQGFHSYFRDLDVKLISPAGTEVQIWKERCSSYNGSFNIRFDDGGPSTFPCPPPNSTTAIYKPSSPLSAFNGQNATGTWTLRVKDTQVSSGGSLQGFELQICSNESSTPPVITVNNVLVLPSGTNAAITEALLKTEDPNNVASQLVYTLLTLPVNGSLELYSSPLSVGSQFTQADIENEGLRFFDYGHGAGSSFQFVVTDGEGGIDLGTFVVSPLVNTKAPAQTLRFEVSPNPADDLLRLRLPEPLTGKTVATLHNAVGQAVRTWNIGQGQTTVTLPVGDLPPGIYALSLENGQVKGTRKIVLK